MSATKHTPGPWFAFSDVCGTRVVADGVGFEPPYRLRPGSGKDPQQVADAHLIAAAPDMLDALEMFAHAEAVASTNASRSFGVYVDAMEAARAAIKKARGEK